MQGMRSPCNVKTTVASKAFIHWAVREPGREKSVHLFRIPVICFPSLAHLHCPWLDLELAAGDRRKDFHVSRTRGRGLGGLHGPFGVGTGL